MSFLKKLVTINRKQNFEQISTGKTFCVMPWIHFHVTQHGTVTPCCQAPWQEDKSFGNINKNTIKEIWNGKKIKEFRKQMLAGIPDDRCKGCYIKENSGFTSLRQITNEKYLKKKKELIRSTANNGKNDFNNPVYFDLRFSNVCNLKCRICGPWSSSSWYNDGVELGMTDENSKAITRSFRNTEAFFLEFEEITDTLEEIYFAGGEPLVCDEHYKILNLLIKKGRTDVQLTYNTNFSSLQYKDFDLISLWKHFPNISIAASLDASGKKGEFLRKNLYWESIVQNRKKIIQELPDIEFTVSPTLNIYNLLHLPDFHKEWVNLQLISVEDFIPTLLITPAALSVHILPDAFKNKALIIYIDHMEWIRLSPNKNEKKQKYMLTQFENILKCLETSKSNISIEEFRRSSKAMDKLRKEKTIDIFPELEELFEPINDAEKR